MRKVLRRINSLGLLLDENIARGLFSLVVGLPENLESLAEAISVDYTIIEVLH